ncbi:MAG: hypothetical protein DRH04_05685 [Deltaproteobacteria bacterium]|nr:MAG: hypothetical protein DRH04_05685 [Deltaproteobacteria bacterium]
MRETYDISIPDAGRAQFTIYSSTVSAEIQYNREQHAVWLKISVIYNNEKQLPGARKKAYNIIRKLIRITNQLLDALDRRLPGAEISISTRNHYYTITIRTPDKTGYFTFNLYSLFRYYNTDRHFITNYTDYLTRFFNDDQAQEKARAKFQSALTSILQSESDIDFRLDPNEPVIYLPDNDHYIEFDFISASNFRIKLHLIGQNYAVHLKLTIPAYSIDTKPHAVAGSVFDLYNKIKDITNYLITKYTLLLCHPVFLFTQTTISKHLVITLRADKRITSPIIIQDSIRLDKLMKSSTDDIIARLESKSKLPEPI